MAPARGTGRHADAPRIKHKQKRFRVNSIKTEVNCFAVFNDGVPIHIEGARHIHAELIKLIGKPVKENLLQRRRVDINLMKMFVIPYSINLFQDLAVQLHLLFKRELIFPAADESVSLISALGGHVKNIVNRAL